MATKTNGIVQPASRSIKTFTPTPVDRATLGDMGGHMSQERAMADARRGIMIRKGAGMVALSFGLGCLITLAAIGIDEAVYTVKEHQKKSQPPVAVTNITATLRK